jgi:predicted dehydrogenase
MQMGKVITLDGCRPQACHDDVDILVIATPNQSHTQIDTTTYYAGTYWVMDKPFAVSSPS